MEYNFTENLRRSLGRAREHAIASGHDYVGTEHILLGLLEDEKAIKLLRRLKVDADAVAIRVNEAVRKGQAVTAPGELLPYTGRAKGALSVAVAEARHHGHPYIGTEHLLLGMMRDQRTLAAQVLSSLGATAEDLRTIIDRFWSTDPTFDIQSELEFDEAHSYLPSVEELKRSAAMLTSTSDAIALIADLDAAPVELVVELMAGLDRLHRAWGGAGLTIDGENAFSVPIRAEALA